MILREVPYPTVSVEYAAKVLRVNPKTLYRNMHEIPHTRIGNYYRIDVSFLFFKYVPDPITRCFDSTYDPDQMELQYDIPIARVRLYRNGDRRGNGDYEIALSTGRKWRNKIISD